jgi:hypothetical protein
MERLGIAITVDVDLGYGLDYHSGHEPQATEESTSTCSLLHFMEKLRVVNWEVARNRGQQCLDRCLVTIDVQKPAHNLRSPHRLDSLNIYLGEFDETVLVKVKNEIMNKVEPTSLRKFLTFSGL